MLTNRERLAIGAVGALAPVVAKLITVDFEQVLLKPDMGAILGWACRAMLLACVGMFVGYIYDDETNKLKLFQLGMAGPALFLATLNANPANVPDTDEDGVVDVAEVEPAPLVCPAPDISLAVKEMAHPQAARPAPTPVDSFMFGLTLKK